MEFKNGLNFSEKNDGVGLPIVKVKDFGNRHFVGHLELDEINPHGLKIGPNQLLRKDDIVIVRSNGNKDLVGRSMIFNGPDDEVSFAGFCIRGRANRSLAVPQFLHYWLRSPDTRERFSREGSGTGIQNVSQGLLQSISVNLPPLPEQREIAGILGALDDKIEVNRKTSALLEEMARALYRSWFVTFDPVTAAAESRPPAHIPPETAALFPASFQDNGLPEGWRQEPIYDQAHWVNGAAYKNMHFSDAPDALPVVKIAELKSGITSGTRFTNTDLGARYRIDRGELLYSWSGNPDTSIDAFIWPLGPAWLNQHIFAVRPNGRGSVPLLFAMLRHFNKDLLELARNKQTTGLGHITKKDLEGFQVVVPPRPVLQAFERLIEPIHARYCQCLYESQTLAALRDSLLPRLMSGELRVGAAREQVEDVA